MELLGPKAHMQGHSAETVKLARAHWESPYLPRVPLIAGGSLQKLLYNLD